MRALKQRRFLAIAVAVLLALFAANAGRMLVVDEPQRSDVIVVLAGETNYRPTRALELFNQGYARRIVMNVPATSTVYEFTQVQLAEKYIQDLPQRAAIAICPIDGLSTRDEARDTAKCLDREAGNRVLIVTSDFHTRRALSVLHHEIRGKVFSIAASHDASQFGTRWWQHRQWAKTCFEEWLRLLWWTAVDRWQ